MLQYVRGAGHCVLLLLLPLLPLLLQLCSLQVTRLQAGMLSLCRAAMQSVSCTFLTRLALASMMLERPISCIFNDFTRLL